MRFPKIAAVLLPLLVPAFPASAEPPRGILFIGNSYTSQVRGAVTGIVAASPHRATRMEFIAPGGKTLEFHGNNPATLERIRTGQWNLVVLQDQSQTPALMPQKFLAASQRLNAAITQAGARTAYYQTWGRRDGDNRNRSLLPTYARMQDALSASYRKAAQRDKALLVPVGEAWRQVHTGRPALARALYKQDGSHPSAKGAFLTACCFYAFLFGEDPSTSKFDGGLAPAEADYLRGIARRSFEAAGRPRAQGKP